MEFPSQFLPRVGMRTLRGNIGSRTASRNEKYKEEGWRKKEKNEDIEETESRDASGISAIESSWPDLTSLEFSGWWTLPVFTFNHFYDSKENL